MVKPSKEYFNTSTITAVLITLLVAYFTTLVNARANPGIVLTITLAAFLGLFAGKNSFKNRNVAVVTVSMMLAVLNLYIYSIQETPDNGLKNATTVPLIIAISMLVAYRSKVSSKFKSLIPFLSLLGCIATCAEISYDYFMQSYVYDSRVAGNIWIGDANASMAAALTFSLTAFFSFKDKGIRIFIVAMACLAMAGSQSRGAFLALITSGLIMAPYFWVSRKGIRPSKKLVLGTVLATFIVPAVVLSSLIFVSKYLPPNISVVSRIAMIDSTIQMIAEKAGEKPVRLVTGNGFSTWRENYTKYRTSSDINSSGITPHHDYLEFIFEGGLVYTGLFVALMGIAMFALIRQKRAPGVHIGLAVAICYVASFAFFNFTFIAPVFDVIIGVAVGVAAGLGRYCNTTQTTQLRRLSNVAIIGFVGLSVQYTAMVFMMTAKSPPFISAEQWDAWTKQYVAHLYTKNSFLATVVQAEMLQSEALRLSGSEEPGDREKARQTAENAASYYYAASNMYKMCNDCQTKIGVLIDAFTGADEIGSKTKALQFAYDSLAVSTKDSNAYFLIGKLELLVNKNVKRAERAMELCITKTVSASYVDGLRCTELGKKIIAFNEENKSN